MESDLPYYVALAAAPGIGPVKFKILIKFAKSAREVWEESEKNLVKILGPKVAETLVKYREKVDPQRYLQEISSQNIQLITIVDKNYPKLLKEIADPPPVLYVRGSVESLSNKRPIAVVGTRKMTSYGREVTEILVRGLVAAGFTVVSGLARGVDSHAHRVTLGNAGMTIAVLGGGVDKVNPREMEALPKEIENGHGAVISEFPLGVEAVQGTFQPETVLLAVCL